MGLPVISPKYLPTRTIGVFHLAAIWTMLDYWKIPPTGCAVVWTLLGLWTALGWFVRIRETDVHPRDIK